ncbi:MAG: hypothetical protein ACQESR_29505 [Planctomycetota bacterium]
MESCPREAGLPLVELAAENVIRDRYHIQRKKTASQPAGELYRLESYKGTDHAVEDVLEGA